MDEPHGASAGGRAEELANTSGVNRSRGLAMTSNGDGTRKSGRSIGRRRSFPDRTGEEDEDSVVGLD